MPDEHGYTTISEFHNLIKQDDPLYKEGFKAGAASRDADIHRLQMALADTEALELGTSEKCDQLREQVAMLRASIQDAVDRLRNTDSWIWEDLVQALAATKPHGRS